MVFDFYSDPKYLESDFNYIAKNIGIRADNIEVTKEALRTVGWGEE